jgi:hypothetical protein
VWTLTTTSLTLKTEDLSWSDETRCTVACNTCMSTSPQRKLNMKAYSKTLPTEDDIRQAGVASPTPDREGGFCQLRTCQAPANAIEIVRTVGISCFRLYSYYSVRKYYYSIRSEFSQGCRTLGESGAGAKAPLRYLKAGLHSEVKRDVLYIGLHLRKR